MKATILLSAMMLMFSSAVYADDISEERAKEIAMEFLDGGSAAMTRSASAAQMKLSRIVQTEEGRSPELYIFNRGNGEGWVIVAGDDSAPSRYIFKFGGSGSLEFNGVVYNWISNLDFGNYGGFANPNPGAVCTNTEDVTVKGKTTMDFEIKYELVE